MGTGLDSFADPQNIGPLYPFVGTEVLLAVVGIALWIAWHVRQVMIENRENARAVELYRQVGLARVVEQNGTESLADEDELRAVVAVGAAPAGAGSAGAPPTGAAPTGADPAAATPAGGGSAAAAGEEPGDARPAAPPPA
jgi:hypothetical protein